MEPKSIDPSLDGYLKNWLGLIGTVPPTMAKTGLEIQLDQQQGKFTGLMLAAELAGTEGKIPQPNSISFLKKRLLEVEKTVKYNQELLDNAISTISLIYGIEPDQARSLFQASKTMLDEVRLKGLVYRGQPFNLALSAPYSLNQTSAEKIAELSTSCLQATYDLGQENELVAGILSRGSTPLEKRLWSAPDGYTMAAPLNRIDLINGRVIEFGPTFADGFATAQVFAEVWGMSSKSVATLADCFRDIYTDYCNQRGWQSMWRPSLGLGYIGDTALMRDEMEVLGLYLERTKRFSSVSVNLLRKLETGNFDMIFYYLKPSMLDGWNGEPIPDERFLIEANDKGVCVVPPLKQQLGKKAVLALLRMYPEYYRAKMGDLSYQDILNLTVPTTIITNDTPLPTVECVIKPSSGGSCDGVTGTSDSGFEEQFRQAQEDYLNPEKDLWVLQPMIRETTQSLWVVSAKKGLERLTDLNIKQTLMVAGGKVAGAFATASNKWIIDDSGYGYPCKLRGDQ